MLYLMRVRLYLEYEAAIPVTNALVSSRLDCCSSLFRSLSSFNSLLFKFISSKSFPTLAHKLPGVSVVGIILIEFVSGVEL